MASVGCSLFPLSLYSLHAHSPTSAKAQVALSLGKFTLRKGIQRGAVGFFFFAIQAKGCSLFLRLQFVNGRG